MTNCLASLNVAAYIRLIDSDLNRGRLSHMTRNEAKFLGLIRYKANVPCHRGHDCERFTSGGTCVECATINRRKHEANNREAYRLKAQLYRQAHPNAHRKWSKTNPIRVREKCWKTYGIHSAVDRLEFLQWAEFIHRLAEQQNRCANPHCKRELTPQSAVADHCHITHVFRAILCDRCNRAEAFINGMSMEAISWFRDFDAAHRQKWE